MLQRIHKFGNSLAIVIPKAANGTYKAQAGTLVEVAETPGGWQVTLVNVAPALSPDLQPMTDDLTEKRAGVFDKLAE